MYQLTLQRGTPKVPFLIEKLVHTNYFSHFSYILAIL